MGRSFSTDSTNEFEDISGSSDNDISLFNGNNNGNDNNLVDSMEDDDINNKNNNNNNNNNNNSDSITIDLQVSNNDNKEIEYANYNRQNIKGWPNDVKYSIHLIGCDDNKSKISKEIIELKIEQYNNKNDEFILVTQSDIKNNVCIGEYTGNIVNNGKLTYKKYTLYLNNTTEIDATIVGNEMRFIGDTLNNQKECNVKFQRKDGHIFVVTLRQITAGEELIADYGDDYRDRVTLYYNILNTITSYNDNLINNNNNGTTSTAVSWFLQEGHKLLKSKVP